MEIHVAATLRPEQEPRWYRKPGGSVHAFVGLQTLCRRFWWQSSWWPAVLEATPTTDVCPVCRDLLTPPETELRALAGDR